MTKLYEVTTRDGAYLSVGRVDATTVVYAKDEGGDASVGLQPQEAAALLRALSPSLRERVRAVLAEIDDCRDQAEQHALRLALAAHLRATAPMAMGVGLAATP